jgi:hypothetical protein
VKARVSREIYSPYISLSLSVHTTRTYTLYILSLTHTHAIPPTHIYLLCCASLALSHSLSRSLFLYNVHSLCIYTLSFSSFLYISIYLYIYESNISAYIYIISPYTHLSPVMVLSHRSLFHSCSFPMFLPCGCTLCVYLPFVYWFVIVRFVRLSILGISRVQLN